MQFDKIWLHFGYHCGCALTQKGLGSLLPVLGMLKSSFGKNLFDTNFFPYWKKKMLVSPFWLSFSIPVCWQRELPPPFLPNAPVLCVALCLDSFPSLPMYYLLLLFILKILAYFFSLFPPFFCASQQCCYHQSSPFPDPKEIPSLLVILVLKNVFLLHFIFQ